MASLRLFLPPLLALTLWNACLPVIAKCLPKPECDLLINTAFQRTALYPLYVGVPDCFNATIHGRLNDNPGVCVTEEIVYDSLLQCADAKIYGPPEMQLYSSARNLFSKLSATSLDANHRVHSSSPSTTRRAIRFNVQINVANLYQLAVQRLLPKFRDARRTQQQQRYELPKVERLRETNRKSLQPVVRTSRRRERGGIQWGPQLCEANGPCCLLLNADQIHVQNCYRFECHKDSTC